MFLVCGEALWDLFTQPDARPGERPETAGVSLDARIGGSPLNVAIGLARLGHRTGFFAGLSSDPFGRRINDALEREGLETRYLVPCARPTTLSLVDLRPDGTPAYTFYGEGAADRALEPADLPDLGDDVWGVHFGSFSLVVEPVGSTLLALAAREAGRRLITLDPNVRLRIEGDGDLWRARIRAFVRHADVVKVSEEDLDLLYPGECHAAIAARWRAEGAGLVVVTCGRSGVRGYGRASTAEVGARRVEVVDAVGAGDSFQAALIAGLAERGIRDRVALDALDDDRLADILYFAVEAAAVTCTRRGADLPRRDELPGWRPDTGRA